MTCLGVDIGVKGAVAVLDDDGQLIEVHDMPCLEDGPKHRRTINAPLFAKLVYDAHATRAYVERVGPRPAEGPVGAFAFGDCAGVIRGVLAAAAITTTHLMPAQWKRAVGIPPGKAGTKDLARSEAIRRWPGKAELFARARDDGRAEAALIAVAGMLRENNVVPIRRPRERLRNIPTSANEPA
jgi:crossover junction endodeoxyribonuclease RuvC